MRAPRTLTATLAAFLALAAPGVAQVCGGGDTALISQLQDYTNGFKSDATPNPQIVAEQVNVASPTTLQSVTVWGGFGPGNTPSNDFTLIVHDTDAAGLPGAALYTEMGISTTLTATGATFPPPLVPLDEYQVTLTPAAPVSLPVGVLWFEVYNDAAGGDAFYWLTGTLDPQTGVASSAIAFNAPGGPWFTLTPDMAIVVCTSDGGSSSTALCFGDGGGTACPCGNEDPGGTGGCSNSTGSGAALSASGSASLAAGDLALHGTNLLPNQPALFFQGNQEINGGAGTPFGDGLRCCGQGVVRLQVVVPDGGGNCSSSVDIGLAGGVAPGETKCYQLWYRDPNGSPCGSNFNLTNALSVTWTP